MEAVDEHLGVIADLRTKPYSEVKRGYTYFADHDVLFAKITPCMQNGKAAIAGNLIDGIGFGSTEFHVLRPQSRVTPDWIYHFVRQAGFREEAKRHFRGAVGQQRVPQEFLATHSIPVPPIAEQRRIVARIEAAFARLTEARRLHESIVQETESLSQAAVEEIFWDGQKQNWPLIPIRDLIVGKPQYGISVKATEESAGIPIIRMGNIHQGCISLEHLKYVQLSSADEEKYLLNEGDILFNRTNSAELVGKSAVYKEKQSAVFASYLIRIVADRQKALPEFIVAYINSPLGRLYIQAELVRAIGQVNVNASKLVAMSMPTPALDVQRRIVAHLDSVQAQVAALRAAQAVAAAELTQLEKSILVRAFRGEL